LERRDDLRVMLQVLIAQGSFAPVFQPLLANLVAADMEVPDFGWDAFTILPFLAGTRIAFMH